MKIFKQPQVSLSLYIGLGFFFVAVLAELSVILILNSGKLVYTLDDPYIHMALAENISAMHYGVNANEFSAPSSSILWPFILAPFASCEVFPLVLNIIFAILTIYVFYKVVSISIDAENNICDLVLISLLLILLILTTNLIGLVFIGMEHNLQVLLSSLIAYGLIVEAKTNRLMFWLAFAVVAAPLIRYENLAVSTTALIYLIVRKYHKTALVSGILLALCIGGFSLFLSLLGLDIIPTSIIAKTNLMQNAGSLNSVVKNLLATLTERQGVVLSIGVMGMLVYFLFETTSQKKLLAVSTIFACLMHFVAGKYGWYHRYEIYIWSFLLLIFLYFIGPQIRKILTGDWKRTLVKITIAAIAFVGVATPQYVGRLFTLPLASNNIYEQQYQLHRFAIYYNKPVAVNDLGYVSYKNDNYVLDLGGLASRQVLRDRMEEHNDDWMDEICRENNVELAMIYESWFSDSIPDNWIKIGELYLGKEKITPAVNAVAFYATNQEAYANIVEKLRLFVKTLPPDVKFTFVENGSD